MKEYVPTGIGDSRVTHPARGRVRRLRALLARPALWILLIAAVAGLQLVSGPHVNAGVLYLVPLTLAAWYGRLWMACAMAVVSPAMQFAFVAAGVWTPPASDLAPVNVLLRIGGFLLVSLLIRRARHAQDLEREVTALRGMLPICLYCKQIQDAEGQWHPVEQYIGARSGAAFTHLVCPVCDGHHRKAFLGG